MPKYLLALCVFIGFALGYFIETHHEQIAIIITNFIKLTS